MNIRPATAADIPALLALDRQATTAAHWSEAQYQGALAPGAAHRLITVTEDETTVAGFLVARTGGPEWEIENIVVASAAQRRGLGARLLHHFFDLAREQGAAAVFLEVRVANAAARALYEKLGFVLAGRRKGYYHDPDDDALVYRQAFPARGVP